MTSKQIFEARFRYEFASPERTVDVVVGREEYGCCPVGEDWAHYTHYNGPTQPWLAVELVQHMDAVPYYPQVAIADLFHTGMAAAAAVAATAGIAGQDLAYMAAANC